MSKNRKNNLIEAIALIESYLRSNNWASDVDHWEMVLERYKRELNSLS